MGGVMPSKHILMLVVVLIIGYFVGVKWPSIGAGLVAKV
jgi:hypothetical protein